MNKTDFIQQVASYIISQHNYAKNENTVLYKDIITWCISNNNFKTFLNLKKDTLIYLDNIIKYDDALIQALTESTQFNVIHNGAGFIEFNHPLTSTELHTLKKNKQKCHSKELIQDLDLSEEVKNRYYCPYDKAIKACKQKARNKFRLSLTNEVVFNVYLQGLTEIQHIIKHLQHFNDLVFVHKGHKIQIFKKHGNVVVSDIGFGVEYMVSSVYDKLSSEYVETLKSIYPFTHFNLTSLIFNFYLIYKSSNSDSKEFLSYLTFLHFELIKSILVNKYFASCKTDEVVEQFYTGRLDTVVRDQTELLKVFLNGIHSLPDNGTEFTSFMVGYYKMFVYIRNLLNREVKKCARDYFHTKINRVDIVSYDKEYGDQYAG